MLIYLLLAAMMPIWGMLWPRNKKIVIFMCCTTMFLFLALRAETLGVDLDNYSAGYNYIRGLNFSEIISRLHFFERQSWYIHFHTKVDLHFQCG